ncbi:MAG: hypothetical protein NTW74_14630 [Acidobacteria bacterium]|nr:hypothetical protein [Acidobacteriota bacterium]
MDGLGIIILGALVAPIVFLVCLVIPRMRPYALAGLVSPFISSIVFLLGLFIIADMNPAIEYGSEYTPKGTEHDPNFFAAALLLIAVAAAFAVSSIVCNTIQSMAIEAVRDIWKNPGPTRIDLK